MTVASFSSCYDKAYFMYFPYQPWCLAASGSIQISVEGGVAPYTWEVSGSAFTLDSAETADQTNTVNAESDAVNGDEETITVTDACGTEVTGVIRCCDSTACCVDPDYSFSRPRAEVYVLVDVYTQVHVQGGCPTYTWELSGVTPSKVTARDAETNSNFNMFKFASDAEANETLTVTDGCGSEVTITLIPTSGAGDPCNVLYYEAPSWSDENSETIARNSNMGIIVDNGAGPFTWEVLGTGFTLGSAETEEGSNTLICDGVACGLCTITVTDYCGESVTGYVRCTTGSWRDTDDCNEQCEGSGGTAGILYLTYDQYRYMVACSWWHLPYDTCQDLCGIPGDHCLDAGSELPGGPRQVIRCKWGCDDEDNPCEF